VRYSDGYLQPLPIDGVSMRSLQCPNCEYRNGVGAKFCNDCGAQLRLTPCPDCGHQPSTASETCSGCGNRRDEKLLLAVAPAQDLPVLEDQLLEEAYFDVPLLSETWSDTLTLLEPERKNSAVSTSIATVLPMPPAVQLDAPMLLKQNRQLRPGAIVGLVAVAALAIAAWGLFGHGVSTVEQATSNVEKSGAKTSRPEPANANPAAAVPAPASAPTASTASTVPTVSTAPIAPVAPVVAVVPNLPAAPVASTAPLAPAAPLPNAAAQSPNECPAALAALSLCPESSIPREPKP
jgi:Double zinc ribbon